MNPSPSTLQRHRLRSRTRRRLFAGLNSGAAILLLLALLGMVNYLSSRHYLRFDLSRDQFYRLSDKTAALVASLPGPVKISVFIQPGHEIYQLAYEDVINLLREYEYVSGGGIQVERIDPDRNLSRAEEIMTRFELEEPNVVIVEHGERRTVVRADELMEIDFSPTVQGRMPEKVSFRGEQAISSAILSVTQPDRPRVYFLQGHGERNFDDRDEYVGMSGAGRLARRDDIDLLPFSFTQQNSLPEDADALIIAGPARAFAAGEIERIAAFVNRAGRLVLMLNAETDAGFGSLLESWGIHSVNSIVVDPTRTLSGFDLLVADYADHPIVSSLKGITTVFYWPRALPLRDAGPVDTRAADEFKAVPLAVSSPNAWAELELEQRPQRFDAGSDLKGPVPVALAVERGSLESMAMDIRPTRAVVFGDVDFASNSGLSGGNGDLFMNALNWVLERDRLMAIAPKPVEEARLMISRRQLSALFLVVVTGAPLLAALAGVFAWLRRRH